MRASKGALWVEQVCYQTKKGRIAPALWCHIVRGSEGPDGAEADFVVVEVVDGDIANRDAGSGDVMVTAELGVEIVKLDAQLVRDGVFHAAADGPAPMV